MAQYFARIENGAVAQLLTLPDGLAIGNCFAPAVVSTLVAASGAIVVGQTYANGAFGPVPEPPAPTQAQLQAAAAAKAQSLIANMRSYTSGSETLKSDATPATLADLMALAQWGAANGSASQNWVANDYSVAAITGAEFVAFSPMVGDYSLSVYAALASVLGEIASGAITTMAEVSAFAWPV